MRTTSELPCTPTWAEDAWESIFSTPADNQPHLGEIEAVPHMHVVSGPDGLSDADYAAILKMTDGTWVTLHAGCDTTGWGCHGDYVRWKQFDTFEEAVTMGLTQESRRWLNLDLPR